MLPRPLLFVVYLELKNKVVLDESKFCSIDLIVILDEVVTPDFMLIVLLQISSVFIFVEFSIKLVVLLIMRELIS